MKNADMPAMPVIDSDGGPRTGRSFEKDYIEQLQPMLGLTKREMMAMHAPEMPDWFIGVWRSRNNIQPGWSVSSSSMTRIYFEWKVYFAEQLLMELDRVNGESK